MAVNYYAPFGDGTYWRNITDLDDTTYGQIAIIDGKRKLVVGDKIGELCLVGGKRRYWVEVESYTPITSCNTSRFPDYIEILLDRYYNPRSFGFKSYGSLYGDTGSCSIASTGGTVAVSDYSKAWTIDKYKNGVIDINGYSYIVSSNSQNTLFINSNDEFPSESSYQVKSPCLFKPKMLSFGEGDHTTSTATIGTVSSNCESIPWDVDILSEDSYFFFRPIASNATSWVMLNLNFELSCLVDGYARKTYMKVVNGTGGGSNGVLGELLCDGDLCDYCYSAIGINGLERKTFNSLCSIISSTPPTSNYAVLYYRK